MATVLGHEHVEEHAAPPKAPPRGRKRFTQPGWLRAAWVTPLTFALVTGLVCLFRYLGRDTFASDPVWDLPTLLTFWTIFVPIGFLAGLGAFDYWAYWISGRRTRPEDHSGHGADSWKDYFRINTDHKVIGVQYVVTTFIFFAIAGLIALFMRAELAKPGSQFVDTQAFNGLFSVARRDHDLPVHRPGLRRVRELRHPADDRCAGHGVPAAERDLVLAAADRRADHARRVPASRRRVRGGLDELPAARPR